MEFLETKELSQFLKLSPTAKLEYRISYLSNRCMVLHFETFQTSFDFFYFEHFDFLSNKRNFSVKFTKNSHFNRFTFVYNEGECILT